jgi:glucokinase
VKVAAAADLGGTSLRTALVAADGRLSDVAERMTPTSSTDAVLQALEDAIEPLLDSAAAIGVGVPGTIHTRDGRVVRASNLPLADVPMRDWLRERFAVPVAVENDANAAAVGEWRAGAGRGLRTLVVLTLGTGVGSGLVLDGRLFRGATGAAAELGYVVLDHEGAGHAETLIAGTAADRAARVLLGADATARDLVERARAGEDAAIAAVGQVARPLGSLLGSVANVLEPEAIVIGGGFGAAWDVLQPEALAVFRREALPPARDTVRVVPAELGTHAGLVGAGLLALDL